MRPQAPDLPPHPFARPFDPPNPTYVFREGHPDLPETVVMLDVGTQSFDRAVHDTGVVTGWYLSGRLRPGEPVMRIPVNHDSFTIGRRVGLHLAIPSARVSGRHAELLLVGGHLFLRDLGSTNGTFVNHNRIDRTRRLEEGDHIEFADIEFRVEYSDELPSDDTLIATLKKTHACVGSFESDWVFSQFNQLIEGRAVVPHYQPLVKMHDRSVFGFEALARSDINGLTNPKTMFDTSSLLGRSVELSLVCRERAIETAVQLGQSFMIFVNTHPQEDVEVDVLPHLQFLRRQYPHVQVVLEVHESAVSNPRRMRDWTKSLKDLGVLLAYDDFGAGQSRLLELVQAPPDVLKFDMNLIRGIDQAPVSQRRMLKMLVEMTRDFSTATLAEGIETAGEAEICRELGFDYGQGYLYGRPMRIDQVQASVPGQAC
jgi:EAL domain-containing protein (putative c-di-GMP-specific phosphodiesterase class I)